MSGTLPCPPIGSLCPGKIPLTARIAIVTRIKDGVQGCGTPDWGRSPYTPL